MDKCKKGDVNLLLFFLVSALFIFGISILWSKNWLIKEDFDGYPSFISKKAIEKKVEEKRNIRKDNLKKNIENVVGERVN
jgi:hypothetical protein